jgi:hypothetical protein
MRRSELTRTLVLGLGLMSAALACQAVAGIEDRKLDTSLAPDAVSPECSEYCTLVAEACQDKHQVYTTEATCLGVCELLEKGTDLEPVGNTVECRIAQAKLSLREPAEHCPLAGPGGGGVCGSDCEAYCQLFAAVCEPEFREQADCVRACDGLTDQTRFDVQADHEGDTIECRLVHVSSATVEPETHCAHAPLAPAEPWCINPADQAPTCEEYCDINLAACVGDLAQYETPEQCLKTCAVLEPGTNADKIEDTVGCRRYHSFSSTLAAQMHCSHSGPSGDGHCGDTGKPDSGRTGNCDSYCRIVAGACPEQFAETFSDAECRKACVELEGAGPDTKYSVVSASGESGLHCRILHATRAFADESACEAALGGAPCE